MDDVTMSYEGMDRDWVESPYPILPCREANRLGRPTLSSDERETSDAATPRTPVIEPVRARELRHKRDHTYRMQTFSRSPGS